jgi:NAD(P)-dependent dehydrogenase (short-subunit alcohol dehydrogenase family)
MPANGRRAIVTGAAGGIGKATCRRLLDDGYRVLAIDVDAAAVHAALVQQIPGARYGRPEEVAELVAFLFSDASSYMSGAAGPIDWGYTAQ